ncbi:class I SAM-dependent methyltransferase [Mariniblastus sp.]|nr:class I SAM-dependent methyltransferase [Mariniblastus sp.]MDB4756817.1 class I SAM-dependent methyltransferase [Mariniblastus sp.]
MNQEVKTELACCLTGSHDGIVVCNKDRHGEPLRTVICKDSGLVFTDPRITPEQIRDFYSEEYRKNYKGVTTPKAKHVLRAGRLAKERLDAIQDFVTPKSSILDVGSGGGEFVYTCGLNGLTASGIEPNKGYANFSMEAYGIDVDCNFFEEVNFHQDSFDCITMFHVMEHLENPVRSLKTLSSFLKPGGVFVVEVPNVDYTETAPNQKWHLGHLYNFNLQTLQAVGIRSGLEPVQSYYAGRGSSLFTVFRKPVGSLSCTVDQVLKGSFESTMAILRKHTSISHFLNVHVPIRRCVTKAFRNVDELIAVRKSQQPKDILNALVLN